MRMILIFSIMMVTSVSFLRVAKGSARSLTPQEQAATCYPSSPLLQSDLCWGRPYMGAVPGANLYQIKSGDPFSDIYSLMYSMQGQGNLGFDPMMGLNLNTPMLWQNTNQMTSPLFYGSSFPMVK